MKITNVSHLIVNIPFPSAFHPAWMPGSPQNSLKISLLKIFTDEGVVGIGSRESFGERYDGIIRNLVKPLLSRKDPFLVERIMEKFRYTDYRHRVPYCEIGMALWDIIGKACRQPLHKLWGGYRDRVKAYASCGEIQSPKKRAEDALKFLEYGFRAIKLRIRGKDLRDDIALVEAVRNAIGDKMEIMVDANQADVFEKEKRWTYKRALQLAKELKGLNVFWLEEPLPRYDITGIAQLTKESELLIAGGENNVGLHEFKLLLENQCYDILQPDVAISEEIFQVKKIADMVEMNHKLFIPHTWSNGIGLAANLQVVGSVPYCPYVEYPYDPPIFSPNIFQEILKEPILVDKEGYVKIPQSAGIGVDLNEEIIERYGTCF